MSDRSGCSVVELAVLEAVAAAAGRSGRYAVSVKAAAGAEARIGLGPRYAYEILVDLASPWIIPLPLVDVRGNIGDRTFPKAEARHTESRLSQAGQLVLDAEAGLLAPVPVGIINGTTFRGGSQPPLQPARVVAGLRALIEHPPLPDRELLAIIGPPYSPAGCTWSGDVDALMRGRRVVLRETAKITVTAVPVPDAPATRQQPGGRPGGHQITVGSARVGRPHRPSRAHLMIESLPGRTTTGEAARAIHQCGQPASWRDDETGLWNDDSLPIANVEIATSSPTETCIAVELKPATDPAQVGDKIAALEGITVEVTGQFPAPVARMLRTWVSRYRDENISASLAKLEQATSA
jgi:hypothetical protein